jgi:hypothetical protein
MRARAAQTACAGLLLFALFAPACSVGVSGLAAVPLSPDDGGITGIGGDTGALGDLGDATTPSEDTGARQGDGGTPLHVDGGDAMGAALASEAGDAATITTSCRGDASGCLVVPPGWTLVAFAATQSSACPAGFASQSADLVEGPSAASACSCGACTVTTPASCAGGTLTVHYDYTTGTGRCNLLAQPGTTPLAATTPGSCGTDLYQGSYASFDIQYSEPAASGGACTALGTSQPGSATYASRDRACSADITLASSCSGSGCPTPSVSGPYRACVVAPGTVACPQGPLSERHVAGTGVSFTCSDCGCAMTSTCTGGTVTLYTDSTCTKSAQPIPIGTCYPIYQNGASYNSYAYKPGAAQSTCQTSGTSTAQNVGLTNEETICCAP